MGVMTFAVTARAQPSADAPATALALRWSAPTDCPEGGYLHSEVSRLTLAAREPRVDVDAKAWKDDAGRWRIALVTQLASERGERIVDADTCALASDAAAMVIALMIDPEGVRARTRPAIDVAEPVAPPVNEAPVAARHGEERTAIAAAAIFDSGSLPSTGFGLGGTAGFRFWPWRDRPSALRLRAELSFMVLPERRARSVVDATRGADLHLVTGALRGVLAYGDVVEGGLAAGFELGSLSGTGFGVRTPIDASALWDAALVGAIARFPAHGPVALRASIELAIPLRRAEFEVAGEVIHRPPGATPRGSLAAELRF